MLRSMCCSFGFFLVALGAGIATRPMQGQTMSFFREFSTPQMDRASAIAADATGVYLFGDRPASNGSPGSAGVTKFDSRGNQLWTRPFSAPAGARLQFVSVASEPTGIYALAVAGDFAQCFIRKYSADGTRRERKSQDKNPHRFNQADAYVLALGSYSPLLARPLGIDLPIYPLKGYSVTMPVRNPAAAWTVSLSDEAHKLVLSRMGDRLRIAGTAELNRLQHRQSTRCAARRS